MAIETRTIDKTGWVDGPWMNEPDRVEWKCHGFDCLILRVPGLGTLCGYVALPPTHPWWGLDYWDESEVMNVHVHGGLTYSAPGVEMDLGVAYIYDAVGKKVCPAPAQPGQPWWIGFDCAHGGDYFLMTHGPDSEVQRKCPGIFGGGVYTPPEPGSIEPFFAFSLQGIYRDIAYVRNEVESLAAQCAAAAERRLTDGSA